MNILCLNHGLIMGGAEHSLLSLLDGLPSEGFCPVVACPSYNTRLIEELQQRAVEVVPVNLHLQATLRNSPKLLKGLWRLNHIIDVYNIDVVYANGTRAQKIASLLWLFRRKPIVWHVRDIDMKWKGAIDRLLSYYTASRIIVTSKAVSQVFDSEPWAKRKVVMVYNGVNTRRFSPTIAGEKVQKEFDISGHPVIGCVGSLLEWKGYHHVINALAVIRQQVPDIKCFIVGEASTLEKSKRYEKHLKELVTRKGLEDNVIFTGFRKDIPQIMVALDIFILPSEKPEPFGRVIIEAMACGKPVIATNFGGPTEIVRDQVTGLLVSPGNSTEIAEAVLHLLDNGGEKAVQMSVEGRKYVEKCFSLESHARQMKKVFEEVHSEYMSKP